MATRLRSLSSLSPSSLGSHEHEVEVISTHYRRLFFSHDSKTDSQGFRKQSGIPGCRIGLEAVIERVERRLHLHDAHT
jgi:hypothetical protein